MALFSKKQYDHNGDSQEKTEEGDSSLNLETIEGTVTRIMRWRESTLTDRALPLDIAVEYIMKHGIDPKEIGLTDDELTLFEAVIQKEKIKRKVKKLLKEINEENDKKFWFFDFRNKNLVEIKIDQIKKLIIDNKLTYEECDIDLDVASKITQC